MRKSKVFSVICIFSAATYAFSQTNALVIDQSYEGDKSVFVTPVVPSANYQATLIAYDSCNNPAANVISTVPLTGLVTNAKVGISLVSTLTKGNVVCIVESYIHVGAAPPLVPPPAPVQQSETTLERPSSGSTAKIFTSSPSSKPAYSRISGGIDVSSSASVDPAAKFLLDGSFEVPLTFNGATLNSRFSTSGYVRLASIAQPGAISGLSDIATYIKPLAASTPNQLVQSAEGNFGLEARISPVKFNDDIMILSAIVDGGIITPLSVSQANPTVYTVNQALYNYYTTAPVPNTAANTAITTACGASFSTTAPCYVAYIPQDRNRFFRNYSGGFTLKKYYYNNSNDSYGFPGFATVTAGQNEYVSGGRLKGVILHVSASWPLPPAFSTKWAGALYVYGGIDTRLGGKIINDPQFLLQTAGSTITTTSNGVAVIPLPQEDRDRYRFGIGVDVVKLVANLLPPGSSTTKQ